MARTEARDLPAFETISCEGSYEIQIECQANQAVTIDTDENLLPLIKTEVKDKSLRIFTEGELAPSKDIRLIISIPKLSEFSIQGYSHGDISNIGNSSILVDVKGSSKLTLTGTTSDVQMNISGSGTLNARNLLSENASIRIYGSGDIHVHTTKMLDAKINGSGTIVYRGDPQVKQEINGSGKIEKERD